MNEYAIIPTNYSDGQLHWSLRPKFQNIRSRENDVWKKASSCECCVRLNQGEFNYWIRNYGSSWDLCATVSITMTFVIVFVVTHE